MRYLNQPSLIRNEEQYVSPETIQLILRQTPQNNPLKICINMTFIKFNFPEFACKGGGFLGRLAEARHGGRGI